MPPPQSPTMDGGYCDDAADAYDPVPPKFNLIPLNSHARSAVNHVDNNHLRTDQGLGIDFSHPDKQEYTLGCEGADILLPNRRSSNGSSHICPVHASFSVVSETGAVLLCDRSNNRTVELLPHAHCYTINFAPGVQSVLVAAGINPRIALGKDHWYKFEIDWVSDGLYQLPKNGQPYRMGPFHAPAPKYLLATHVGTGSYGTVWSAVDMTNGRLFAVKQLSDLSGKKSEFAAREIANLLRINRDESRNHDHILDILGYAGGRPRDNWCDIFMPLMPGNLKTLVEQPHSLDEHTLSEMVLHQMLLALECLDSHKIIHRDVKPENILWEYREDYYHFRLGDFGLSHNPEFARTAAGTEPFMAPEIFYRKEQTAKVDIWSLFATIVWTRTPDFRHYCSQMSPRGVHNWLVNVAEVDHYYGPIRGMASWDPKRRPSATLQLKILASQWNQHPAGEPDTSSLSAISASDGCLQPADDLDTQFAGMTLQGGGRGGDDDDDEAGPRPLRGPTYDSDGVDAGGPGGMATSPEMDYYEPYSSGVYNYLRAGPSERDYVPHLPHPADMPRVHEQPWVMPYEPAYAPLEGQNSGSGTAVPDTRTAMPPTVDADDESA